MKRIIAIDIDGTLFNDQSKYDIERFNRDYADLLSKEILMVPTTGNSYDAVRQIFCYSPQVTTFIAENGGRVVVKGKELGSRPHPWSFLNQLIPCLDNYHADLLSLSGSQQTYIERQYENVPVPFYPHHSYFTNLKEIMDDNIYNVNISWFRSKLHQKKIQEIVDQLNQQFVGQLTATYSGAYGIDILPFGVNKKIGLKTLVESFPNLSLTDVVAFGDTSNDVEMLQAVGIGYAMKNATPDLLAVADQVTEKDNNHEGLLNEIENLFL